MSRSHSTLPSGGRSFLRILGIVIGCVVLALLGIVFCFAIYLSSGFSLADDTSSPWTQKGTLEQTRSAMPTGTRLYWLGPSSTGVRLTDVGLSFDGDPARYGAHMGYYGEGHGRVYVDTYVDRERPPADTDLVALYHRQILGRVVTSTNQLILLTCSGSSCPSLTDVERLKRNLRPVTAVEIAELPDDWSEIPVS